MSCAQHLAEHPDNFEVTLIDAANYCGGQAFSIPLDEKRHGAGWLNQGVQGGSCISHHTMTMFARQGYHADPVKLQVLLPFQSHSEDKLRATAGLLWQRRHILDQCLSNRTPSSPPK
jgi:hypothetical protein